MGNLSQHKLLVQKKKMHIYKFLEATSNTAGGKAKNSTRDRGAELRRKNIIKNKLLSIY